MLLTFVTMTALLMLPTAINEESGLCAVLVVGQFPAPFAQPCSDPRCLRVSARQGDLLSQTSAATRDAAPGLLPANEWISFAGGGDAEFCLSKARR
jgi:hypothetical protein